ncbi:MAG: leucine-rich repeat domain-containing protein [Paludibacteraceae bacterium]|nr:leucine-rich repeat domain-containing protein [Paludibacteraceae bacterium]
MRKRIIFSLLALLVAAVTYAYDFTAECSSGQTLAYTIVDAGALTCEVSQPDVMPAGDVTIDATVVNPDDSKTYTVIGVGSYAFYIDKDLTGITFPTAASFTYIGKYDSYQYCFNNCSNLKGKLVIPDNVTEIGCSTFSYTGISEIQFGSGVTRIGGSAFNSCKSLKHVELPDAVTYIGSTAFGSCSNMTYFGMGSKITSLAGDFLHYDTKLDTVVIKCTTPPAPSSPIYESVTSNALLYVPSGSVEAYKAATYWKAFKFIYAEGTPVTFVKLTVKNNAAEYINHKCYVYANSLSINYNGGSAKYVSGETAHITLEPQKYWAVESVTLNDVDVLAQFTNNEADLVLTEDATLKVEWKQDHPYDFTEKVKTGQTLCFRIIDAVNHKVKIVNQSGGREIGGYTSYGYVHKETEGYYVGQWREGNELMPSGDLVIPTEIIHEGTTYTIEEIDTLAFSRSGITGISIPEGIKKISSGAFYECFELDGDVCLPQSCVTLGAWSFRGCSEIKTFSSFGGVTELNEYTFLTNYHIKHLQIPSTVTKINNYAISSMSAMRSIELSENLVRVGAAAFSGNTSNLKTVTIYATTPPQIKGSDTQTYEDDYWYNFNPSSATLYVPKSEGSTVLAAYKAHKTWSKFGTILELPDQYTITTAVKTAGTGSVIGGGKYESGTDTILTALPALYYEFVKWSDGNTDNPRRITVTGDATYTAEFGPRYTKVGDRLEMMDHGQTVRFEVISVKPNEVKLVSNGNYYRGIASDWTIPGTVTDYWGETFTLTRLGAYCLYNTNGIDTLRIPEGVRVVESSALYNSSSFKRWYFPSTIDSIYGNNATYCGNLQDVRFAGVENLRYVDFSTLCSETYAPIRSNTPNNSFCIRDGVALFYKGSAPKVFDIPEGVKIIGRNAVYYTSMYDVEIVRFPSTIKRIGDYSFRNLPSKCTTIYIGALLPPVAQKDVFSYESSKKVIIPCDGNLGAYRADAYWSTLDTIVNGTQFIATVEKVNNYGSYEIKEPTCGTIRIVAKPNTYYTVDEWGTGAKDVDSIDVVMTKDSTITLKFKLESYTVRFLDWDNTEVYPSQKIQRYQYVSPVPDLPDNKTGYTADNWERSDGYSVGAYITQNVDFKAHYSANTYHIVFRNWNGDLLHEYDRKYDETVYYSWANPTRPENDTCTYAFSGWDPACTPGVTTVTGNMTFVAQFTPTYKDYTITFKNYDGTELDKQTLHLGDVITYKGATPTKPYTDEYVYTFIGWNNGFVDGVTKVSKDISTYIAQFEQKANAFTITFLNYDDSELDKQTLRYDDDIVYKGEEPKRDADKQYIYTFDTWDPVLPLGAKVTGDATYKATYKTTLQTYTVTFLAAEGGAKLDEKVVEYGSDATSVAPDITAITPADKQFDRWSEDITNVQGDMTVWPLWKDKTGINNVEAESQATKFMKNGQLFIRRGDKIFNATGAKVK